MTPPPVEEDVRRSWLERPLDEGDIRAIRELLYRFPPDKQNELVKLLEGMTEERLRSFVRLLDRWDLVRSISLWAVGAAGTMWASKEVFAPIIAKLLKAFAE